MNIDLRREKIKRWAQVGLIALAALIVSPIIFMVVKGIVGLAMAAIAGLTIVTFAPWVSMKFANWKVKAIVHEATQNPIETLQNLLIEKRGAFEQFRDRVEDAVRARNEFKQRIEAFAQKYPARAPEFAKQLEQMTVLVERKKEALETARDNIKLAEDKLVEMKAYWEMSQAAIAANAAANMDIGDQFAKLKSDTSCDAVFNSMNRAFAELEVQASLDSSEALSYNEPVVLETAVIKEKVKV